MQKITFEGPCVYFLMLNKAIIYIGQTVDLNARLVGHRRTKKFDDVRYIECVVDKLNYYEKRLINYFKPVLNTSNLTSVTRIARGLPCKRIQLRLDKDVLRMAHDRCDETHRSFNNYITRLILNDCIRNEKTTPKA